MLLQIQSRSFMMRTLALVALVGLAVVPVCSPVVGDDENKEIALNGDAYAILNRYCFECHGRDRQDGGLRLDSRQALLEGGDSGAIVDLANVDESELLRRITLPKSDSEVMPKRGDLLTKSDLSKIEQWLKAGAVWSDKAATQKHWSYVAPKKSDLPKLDDREFLNPIDSFVAQRLYAEGLDFAPPADPSVIARRIYFDVIGLPPSVRDVESFVSDASRGLESAVSGLVDKLLASPQYGDKWARPWLDAARYADSHGFQRDDLHDLWAYRDWVIRALNEDMPFDRFTIEQLAGDLMPDATESQKIATGFNRCSPCNVEAGTDPEENRFNQVVDRVNTLGYAWLGSSLECAQCHDHKYDPFTQREYYGLFAFFNQTELEADRTNPKALGSIKFMGPYMQIQNEASSQRIAELESKIKGAKQRLASQQKRADKLATNAQSDFKNQSPLQPLAFESLSGASHELLDDQSILLREDAPDTDTYLVKVSVQDMKLSGLLIEAISDPSLPGNGPGRGDAKRPNFVLSTFEVYPVDGEGKPSKTRIALTDAIADFEQANFQASKALDEDEKTGWAINPQFGKSHWAAFRIQDPASLDGVNHLQLKLVQNFGAARTIGRLRVSALTGDYPKAFSKATVEDPKVAKLQKEIAGLEQSLRKIDIAKTLVTREVDVPRMSTMFSRGDFRSPTDQIEPHTPGVLHPFKSNGPNNRLDLAQWLVSPENPLVGRVIVNRMWGEIFGTGMVSTPEDFGLKGEQPSHPELLDWLAVDFVEQGWSQKKMLRRILTSQTYLQSSHMTSQQIDRDPDNALLGRGSRFRLPAESIRDNALAIAGLLSSKQFGPPIRPPQPKGLWTKVGGQAYEYETSEGEDKYRRGIYVVLKRMSPYPSFVTFDATARLACRVKRGRSNTPLQALTLLNDPVYVEAAEAFADRVRMESTGSLEDQLTYAFRLAVARAPKDFELSALKNLFQQEKEFTKQPVPEDAAWYSVASALLNLDETITKE
jgi:hypothetical protein